MKNVLFNDYIKDKSITWHCDKKDEITDAMQKAISMSAEDYAVIFRC